ncbi:hypothetical protein GUJ93_ZPchr0007g5450 [Zizania palustris]|uniref:Uncharacterized protein n=1 Tax=Zizania palustris TaxID=103762 RepID=A0A8J5W6M0_ZIZPA|nr:hypothetical protein GUJ93_ZPchr0007g5450 [Zizania palustris]
MFRWDSYYQLNARELVNLVKDGSFNLTNDPAQLGLLSSRSSLLQLLCSLVDKSDLEDPNGQDIYVKLVDVVPKLVALLRERQDAPKSLCQYLKHKILMIMMRLKPYAQKDCSHIVCWLKLLQRHFHDLLHGSILQHNAIPETFLEGSPFLLSTVGLGETQDKSTRHLQRQAMFLFLSCCICLAYNGNGSALQCSCKRDDRMVGHKVQGCNDHCSCFGLSEISDWFQRCFLEKIFGTKSSTDIALCFLQLYMEEDDMLFSILLQLLDAPLISLKIDSMEIKWTSELICGKLFSSIFDPIHIFHLFLLLKIEPILELKKMKSTPESANNACAGKVLKKVGLRVSETDIIPARVDEAVVFEAFFEAGLGVLAEDLLGGQMQMFNLEVSECRSLARYH